MFLPFHPAVSSAENGIDGLFDIEIRVELDSSANSAEIGGAGGKLLVSSAESGARLDIADGGELRVESGQGGIKINHRVYPVKGARVESSGGMVSFDGKNYRGYFLFWGQTNGTVEVVNHLSLEDYIKSVVSREMPAGWPLEALKAQAVAARTYALYKRQDNSGNRYDVAMDVSDQVYGGAGAENPLAEEAVKETSGMVLTYENKLALTYFHSNSGGRTENAVEVFHGADLPYLRSVVCRYAGNSPYYTWQVTMKTSEMESALSRNSVFPGKIRDITVQSRTSTGRVRLLRIFGNTRTETVDAQAFRRALGTTKFKSTRFNVRRFGQTYTFTGNGYGHGVGMCQWGAKGMADNRSGFREILSHYYPGASVTSNVTSFNAE